MPFIWHTVLSGKFPLQFENKYTIFWMEELLMIMLDLTDSVGVDRGGF